MCYVGETNFMVHAYFDQYIEKPHLLQAENKWKNATKPIF